MRIPSPTKRKVTSGEAASSEPTKRASSSSSQKFVVLCALFGIVLVVKLAGDTRVMDPSVQNLRQQGLMIDAAEGGGEEEEDLGVVDGSYGFGVGRRDEELLLAELRKADLNSVEDLREALDAVRNVTAAVAAAAAAAGAADPDEDGNGSAPDDEKEEEIDANADAIAEVEAGFDPSDVCSVFPSGVSPASATTLWRKHLPEILRASANPYVPEPRLIAPDVVAAGDEDVLEALRNETLRALLEDKLPAHRLRRAVRHIPTFRRDVLDRVMGIVERRMSDPETNPPLRIAVFGGSVTIGRECLKGRSQHKDCAWPKRLEDLINNLVGGKVVEVFNVGIGGTGSAVGENRVKYWMYGPGFGVLSTIGPDVIVNSYSTNDSLPPWDKKWPEDDLKTIVREKVHRSLEGFVRSSLGSRHACDVPPLVVHVDDYLGPQEPDLLGHLVYVQEMTQIAKHYDTMAVSYGEVVRDLVYEDPSDHTFTGINDVHFGSAGHQTIAWSAAFGILQLLVDYCDDRRHDGDTAAGIDDADDKPRPPPLTKDEMREKKLYLPPALGEDLLLENVTAEYESALEDSYRSHVSNDCASYDPNDVVDDGKIDRNPCEVAWISTPGSFQKGDIEGFVRRHRLRKDELKLDGWEAEKQMSEGWGNKDGWVATKEGAIFELEFPDVSKEIKTVTIYFLRSYGEKWAGSRARFTLLSPSTSSPSTTEEEEQPPEKESRVLAESSEEKKEEDGAEEQPKEEVGAEEQQPQQEVGAEEEQPQQEEGAVEEEQPEKKEDAVEEEPGVRAQYEIDGVWEDEDYRYSLTLSETHTLSETVPIGGTVTLRVELVGGSHFKIMGMMLCNK